MTRSEREQLIERYLREELTLSEEHDFFIEAATDKELRADLKASRVVENAFRKDRKSAPSSYSPMRSHLAGLLAVDGTQTGSEDEEIVPTASRPGTGSRLGWIATAASIGLVSLASLLIGIVAIDQNSKEEKTGTPVTIEGSAPRRDDRIPHSFAPGEGTIESSTETTSSGEERDPIVSDRRESQTAPLRHNGSESFQATSRSNEPAEAVNSTEPPQPLNGSTPENTGVDTTNSVTPPQIQFEGPRK